MQAEITACHSELLSSYSDFISLYWHDRHSAMEVKEKEKLS